MCACEPGYTCSRCAGTPDDPGYLFEPDADLEQRAGARGRPLRPGDGAVSGEPYPKDEQLARGSRRYRRRVASPRQWQAIIAEKLGPCRVCCDPGSNGSQWSKIQLHHLVSRAQGGDDVPANIVPLCPDCHPRVTRLEPEALRLLAASLTDAERAYIAGKRR